MNIGELWAQIGLDTVKLKSGLSDATNMLSGFESSIMTRSVSMGTAFTAIGAAAVTAFTTIATACYKAIDTIDDFQVSVLQVAAQITQLQGPNNVAENFKAAKEYSEALAEKLEEIDANSFASAEGLMSMNQALVNAGVLLDVNNQKEVDAFTSLSNAIAMYTKGQNQQIQFQQEIRALTTGTADAHAQVARILDAQIKQVGVYKGGLKDLVEASKEHGDLLERLTPYLVGINAATEDIQKTWSAVSSSMETAVKGIIRSGFAQMFADVMPYLSGISDYLKEHREMIANRIQQGWLVVKAVAQSVWSILEAFKGPLSVVWELTQVIIRGWSLLTVAVIPPLLERISIFVQSLWEAVKAVGSLAEMGGRALVGDWSGAAAAWRSAKDSYKNAGKLAGQAFATGLSDEVNARAAKFLALDEIRKKTKPQSVKPNIPGGAGGEDEYKDNTAAEAAARTSYLDYLKSYYDRVAQMRKDANTIQLELDKAAYDQGRTDLQSYLNEKSKLTEASLRVDLEVKQKELEQARRVEKETEAAYSKDATGQAAARVHQAYATTEKAIKAVNDASTKLRIAQIQDAEEARKAILELHKSYQDLSAQVLEQRGLVVEAAQTRKTMAENEPKYWQMVANAMTGSADAMQAFWDNEYLNAQKVKKVVDDLKRSYMELAAQALEAQGYGGKAAEVRKSMSETEDSYWQLVERAMTGAEDAMQAFWDGELVRANKVQKAKEDELKSYNDVQAAYLDSQGKYAEAEALRQSFDQKTIAFINLKNRAAKEGGEAAKALEAVLASAAQKTAEATRKGVADQNALTLAILETQKAAVNTAEEYWQIDHEEAAAARINILQQELALHQQNYAAAKGNEPQVQQYRIQELAQIQAINAELLKQQKIISDRSAYGGAVNALREYADMATNIGQQVKSAITDMFKGMENALVDFVQNGKADFKELADSIIRDMIRIMIQQSITGPLAQGIGNFISSMFSNGGSSTSVVTNSATGAAIVNTPTITYSGAGGFDIPAGLNPVVQAHQKEMLLPQREADVIRKLADMALAPVVAPVAPPVYQMPNIELNVAPAAVADIPSGIDPIMKNHELQLASPQSTANVADKVTRKTGEQPSVELNVTNNSSAQVDAKKTQVEFDGKKFVIGVVLEDVMSGGILRNALGMAR